MNEVKKKADELDPLKREALGWVQLLTSGEVTVEDGEALAAWRHRSPAHEQAFVEASRMWKAFRPAGKLLRAGGEASAGLVHLHRAQQRPAVSRRLVLGGGGLAAASVAVYTVLRPPFHLWPSLDELRADYRTGTGEQRELALTHGLTVRLNTQTSLAVEAIKGPTDQLILIAGEASFTSAPAAGRPLIVTAGEGRIVARAAQFDIRCLGDSAKQPVRVTCAEGDVQIEHRSQTTSLTAGQQVQYGIDGMGPVAAANVEAASAWQRGVLIFRSTPLSTVIDEVNRYRPGKVILLNEALARTPVSGRFPIDRMDEILGQIETTFGARFHSLPGGIVLLT
jgi:transmembrane sensor